MDIKDFPDLKKTSFFVSHDVEEIENSKTGERCLSPTQEWAERESGTSKGSTVAAFTTIMNMMGVPPAVMLTIISIAIIDAEKNIDYVDWINSRSNWKTEDKEAAISVLRVVEENVRDYSEEDASKPSIPVFGQKQKNDDWRLN